MKKRLTLIFTILAVLLLLAACSSGSAGTTAASSGSGGIFSSLWKLIAIPMGYLMRWCYLFANDVLGLPKAAYVIALFLFTLITKILMFPLSVKQQRSSAMMAAYKPMIDDINAKYKNNPEKRQQEMEKLQSEYGYNPMSGCLPLLIQFPIIFGLIEVIYSPLTYMLRLPAEFISKAKDIVLALDSTVNTRLIETSIIQHIKENAAAFSSLQGDYGKYITEVSNFNMSIGSINLWEKPQLAWSLALLVPVFSIVTMLLSQWVTMKISGQLQSGGGTNMTMMITMSVMFGVFSFMYPMGFSLYWGFQNLIIIAQSGILQKICNPEKLRAEAQAKLEEKRKARKAPKTVKIKEEDGEVIEKEIAPAELAKMRLQKARDLDKERYDE
ncbi:MAG: YidC/Oxa1 family membrane protein insertase [Oscillospiraceae bacterium]|nr:YidC/Oxa1 family membrane protein insertase [Oscillospiraceae bacterium]